MRRLAFTLVELLVVIAIVALLVGLVLPALGAARERGYQTRCLANMRTIGQAVVMYANDCHDAFPLSAHTLGNAHAAAGRWLVTLNPYGVISASRRCPSDPFLTRSVSYSTNDYMEPPEPGAGSQYPTFTHWSQVPRSSAVVYVAEPVGPGYTDHFMPNYDNWTKPADIQAALAVTLHLDGADYLYVDGHAAPIAWSLLQTTFNVTHNLFNPTTAP